MHPSPVTRAFFRWKARLRWRRHHWLDGFSAPPATLSCPSCGSSHPTADYAVRLSECVFGGGPLRRHVCPDCDLIFGTQRMLRMSASDLAREYRELYATYEEGDSTESEIASFRLLGLRPGGRYLNYGCGRWSRSIPTLRAEGFDVVGFEPFSHEGALPEYIMTDEADVGAQRFDGILTHNILEHVQDPVAFTKQLGSWLKPGGRLVHATPCYEYAYDFTRFHVVFFPGRSAEVLAARCGMTLGPLEVPVTGQLARVFKAD